MKKLLTSIFITLIISGFPNPVQAQDEVDTEMLAFMIDFTEKLATLLDDYSTNFSNTVGQIIPNADTESVFTDFTSKVNLPETIESYFTRTSELGDFTYVGVFAETEDPNEAYEIYSGVSFLVELGTYDCCELETIVMPEKEDAYLARTVFVPKVNSGYPDVYNKMNLSVSVYSTLDIDNELNIIDLYLVVLNINKM